MSDKEKELLQITEERKTPFYVYDKEVIAEYYNRIMNAFGSGIEIYYSIKSNSNIQIASLLQKLGAGIEVASAGELMLAEKSGFNCKNTIFSGPGKTHEELREAIKARLLCIMIDSIEELETIQTISAEYGIVCDVGFRVNPNASSPKFAALKMGGEKQFGIDEEIIGNAIERLPFMPNINLMGIQIYLGTQILEHEEFLNYCRTVQECIKRLYEKYSLPFKILDIGGGMGISYVDLKKELNLQNISAELKQIIFEYHELFPDCKVIVESGRFLLAMSGYYITKILYKKQNKGITYLVTDGGMNHCCNATYRGKLLRNNFPLSILGKPNADEIETEIVNIVGPLCTPDDLLGNKVSLPIAEIGDYVCVHRMGAYGYSFSPLHFLGHDTPEEILLCKSAYKIIRNRGKKEELLLNQIYE